MKKVYSKPEIMFESFTMSTNIAAGCEEIFGLYARGTCGIPGSAPELIIFNTDAADSNCKADAEAYPGEPMYDGLCYHVPTASENLFNS